MQALVTIVMTAAALSGAAQAQPPADPPAASEQGASTVSPELRRRAENLVALLNGQADPQQMLSPTFLAQIPAEQVRAIAQQLVAGNGAAQAVATIVPIGPLQANVTVAMERSLVTMAMNIEQAAPNRITGLRVTAVEPRGTDSAAMIVRELQALPGQVSFQIARLGDGVPAGVTAHQPERALAIGSSFKLIILAELARQIGAGQRRWSDVVPIDRHSLPSGQLQEWPLGSPVTLHTLAALMISRSDNTATDVLLRFAGRENVERMMTRMALREAARNRPFLSTLELFQLKADSAQVRAQYVAGDEAARRRLLRDRYERGGAALDFSRIYAEGPVAVDTIEWFASATDMVRIMDWLRRHGGDTALAIAAINSGIGPDAAGAFSYFGFKGGSEPGVINLTFLIRNNAGIWHVVTGGWNNPAAPVDEARFLAVMTRAVRLVR